MPILAGHDEAVTQWAAVRLGRGIVPPATTLGWIGNEGVLTAVALFHDYYRGGNIDLCMVADRPFAKTFIKSIFGYVFNQLGCARMTARPPASNVSACEQLKRAGFRPEANCKAYYGTEDAVQFRILRDDARKWL